MKKQLAGLQAAETDLTAAASRALARVQVTYTLSTAPLVVSSSVITISFLTIPSSPYPPKLTLP